METHYGAGLKKNRHVRFVSRDRASAYSSAIDDILPHAVQIADRFHLLQNLLTHVQSAIKAALPSNLKIPINLTDEPPSSQCTSEKVGVGATAVQKAEEDRKEKFNELLNLHKAGYSKRFIAKHLRISRNTVTKVLDGNPEFLCRKSIKSKLDKHLPYILAGLKADKTVKTIYIELQQQGYDVGCMTNFYNYANKVAAESGITPLRYKRQPLPDGTVPEKDFTYLSRAMVMDYIWSDEVLAPQQIEFLYGKYNIVAELKKKVIEFKNIFIQQKPHLLYAFIDNCMSNELLKLRSFAKGLLNDFEAVDQAVSSELSNGFVEGTNNKIKMVKRQMYGRAHLPLLKAKLMFSC